jgi:triosephosphate isomerase (TIM)
VFNVIIINFKNYVFGKKALALAKRIERVNGKVIVAVPSVDIEEIASNTKLKVYAEHVDYVKGSKTTGYVIPESVKAAGGKGMLINHSEHKLSMKEIKETVKRCNKLRMETVVCVGKLGDVKKIMKLKPKAIAYEDPALISTGKSITKYDAKSVEKFALMFKKSKVIPLCGAGVSTREDIKAAKDLGCKGVLVASAVARDGKVGILG